MRFELILTTSKAASQVYTQIKTNFLKPTTHRQDESFKISIKENGFQVADWRVKLLTTPPFRESSLARRPDLSK
jgi:hypothetical protein